VWASPAKAPPKLEEKTPLNLDSTPVPDLIHANAFISASLPKSIVYMFIVSPAET
jgi:hypothetical protein